MPKQPLMEQVLEEVKTGSEEKAIVLMNNQRLAEAITLLIDLTPEARVELIRSSPYGEELFMGYYFAEYIKYPFADFHFEMFQDWRDLREGKIRELVWCMYRESAKTSLAKVLITKSICYKERSYLNSDSFDKNNSETFLFDVAQNLLSNRRIIRDFGFLYEKKRSTEEMTLSRIGKFLTKNNVLVEAHSVAESVRGRIFGAQRPDFVVLDDFETNKTKDSEAYTSVTKGHIEEFASGLDSKAGILYLCNYITKNGVVQWLMDRAVEDKRIRIRMVAVEEAGKPTWGTKYAMTDEQAQKEGKVSLEDKKKQFGFVVYQTEMMNNPIGSEFQVFKKEMFTSISYDEVMKMATRNFMTIDTAISQKASGDYTGITINFIDKEGFWNIMTFKRKMTTMQLIDFIIEYKKKYNIEIIGIEKTTHQMALKEFFYIEMRKRNTYFTIFDLKYSQKSKEERIRGSLLGRYEAKSIRHIEGYCEGLEDELIAFPLGKNDDVIDSLAYQEQVAQTPNQSLNTKITYTKIDNFR